MSSQDPLLPIRPHLTEWFGTSLAADIGEDDNLIEHGLDSIRLMRLTGALRSGGARVTVAELSKVPTLRAWAALASNGGSPAPTATDGGPVDETAPFDLAPMQHAYWVGRRDGQELGGVAAHFYTEFDGAVRDAPRLDRAVRELIARHGMLRARFLDDGQQLIGEPSWAGLTVHDLSALPEAEVEGRLAALRDRLSHRRMDVERGEVFDVALTLLPGGRSRLHLNLDMLVADAVSLRVLLSDLAALYRSPEQPLSPIGYSYPRYLADRRLRRAATREADREWWQQRIADLPTAPRLPMADPGAGDLNRVARLHHRIDPEERARFAAAAHRNGVTPAAALATVFAEVLAAWSDQPRFLLNVPLFDREPVHPDVDRLVGDFSSSLLVDADLSRPLPFAEQARRVQARLHEDAAHGAYPGVDVLRDLSREQHAPVLAPVVYTSALGLGELFDAAVQGCFGAPAWIISQGPQVWLDAQVTELDGGLLLNWDVRPHAFGDGVLDAMFTAYRTLIASLVEDEDAWTRPVGALLPGSALEVRRRANDTDGPVAERALHAVFFDLAQREPGRTALLWGADSVMTYGELSDAARRVAALLHERGVRPGDSVAITLPKGVEQVVAVLGTLAAGAAYVPVGIDQPAHRRARIYRSAGARLVLAATSGAVELPGGEHLAQVAVADAAGREPLDRLPETGPESVAYVIFTSGSTGDPKGVEVPHRAVVNTLTAVDDLFGVGPDDRTVALSALDFDLSAYDLFGLLSVGGSVVVIDEDARRDAHRWAELIRCHGVTVLSCVPALLDMLLTAGNIGPTLRLVMLGGDWVGLDQPARLRAQVPGCRFVALGGMTEAAIHSTVFEVGEVDPAWRSVPYGRPLRGVRCRVVDTRGRDCPDLVPGELWVGGRSVALGYRGDPERTAAKFVDHDGGRWYRTGDLARYWPDGTLEFLGRADHQVKIRGHRIELGEIEAALESHPLVGHAVATVVTGPARRLAAAVSPAPTAPDGPGSPLVAPAVAPPPDDAAEAALVEEVLRALLPAGDLDAVVAALGVIEENRPLLRLWLDWLAERSGRESHPVPRPDHLAPIAARWHERLADLEAILRGEQDVLTLLDDPVLAPEALAWALPGTADQVGELAAVVGKLAADLERPIRVADLGARTGRTAAVLASALPDTAELTLLDTSYPMLAAAGERLAGLPHRISYQRLDGEMLPEAFHGAFDAVIANNSLHTFADPALPASLAALLLRPGGTLLALEGRQLSPLALLSAAIPERGFVRLDPARRARRSPLLSPAEWSQVLGAHGFTGIAAGNGSGPLLALHATRGARPAVRDGELRDWLSERLPGYMVPERIAVLARMPLTANGKLDRARVGRLLTVDAADEGPDVEPPVGEVERLVADVWAELLGTGQVGTGQVGTGQVGTGQVGTGQVGTGQVGTGQVGRNQSFFALGGDSLLATRLVSRLRAAGLGGVELAALFATPVLADFAATLTLGAAQTPITVTADPDHRHEPFPATDVQRAYFIGRGDGFALGGVGTHYYTEFDGDDVDLARLERAWDVLIARHEMLRAVFDAHGDQRILPEVPPMRIPVTDVEAGSDEEGGDPQPALDALRERMSHQVLDPTRWPLFDMRAVRYHRDGRLRTRLGLSLENILLDGRSMMIVYSELNRLYVDLDAELPPVDVSFRDYLLQVRPTEEQLAVAQEYWRVRAAELPPAPALPLATRPEALGRPRFVRRETRLDPAAWRSIRRKARAVGLTPSTVLLACYGEVLGTWSGRPDVTLNLTLFDRRDVHADINNILGDFTSLLLVSYEPRAGEGWLDSARRLQERLWRDLDHRDVSGVWVLRELARREGATDAAAPVVFTSGIGVDDTVSLDTFPPFPPKTWGISQSPQVWLDNQVYESAEGLTVNWDAVEELFPPGLLDAMFAAYRRLLDWLVTTDWTAPAPALLPEAQARCRARVNDTAGPLPGRGLHTRFFELARAHPHATALLWGRDGALTYGELSDTALRVAALLRRRGVDERDTVAVTLPKGPDQIVAVLGTLAAGAVYVPVSTDQPALRRAAMHAAAGVRTTLDEAALAEARNVPRVDAPASVDPDESAYVIFTSGSTGAPKGVEISHRAALNTIDDINERLAVAAHDRVLAVSALDFDLSVYDVFGLLSTGGAVVLPDEAGRRDAAAWLELMHRHGVTLWNSVPALFDIALSTAVTTAGPPPSLRAVLLSGDWVGLDLPGRLHAHLPGARLLALGGATEGSIWSNAFEVTEVDPGWASVPYGFPLRNQRYRVVDPHGRDCPDWVPGELWIGGAGVARGYRGEPELTARKFVFRNGGRWYRTGDLGRYRPDGTLEFLGRTDHQVKVRGHRIELGEIEAALAAHPGVRAAVAVAVGERTRRRLHAFVTGTPAPEELAAFAAERLPAHAVPGRLEVLDALPLSPNGKVDRAALGRMAEQALAGLPERAPAPPRGPLETAIAQHWARLLDLDPARLDREDSFFALGGDSMLAMRLAAALKAELGIELPLARLFSAPTIAGIAETAGAETAGSGRDIEEGEL